MKASSSHPRVDQQDIELKRPLPVGKSVPESGRIKVRAAER